MVSVADNVTGHMVELLKKKGMWENTLIFVSADNGSAACMGSNYPLKGSKGTFFEGGVRALAFASGGLLPGVMRGKSSDGFIHIADWYTTFCNLAGVDPTDSGPGKLDWMCGLLSPAQTPIHNMSDRYKLIVGNQGDRCNRLMWSPLECPCSDGPKGEDCNPYSLYDIVGDPGEMENLVDREPDILRDMLSRYNAA